MKYIYWFILILLFSYNPKISSSGQGDVYPGKNVFQVVSSGTWSPALFDKERLPGNDARVVIPANRSVVIPSSDSVTIASLVLNVLGNKHSSLTVDGELNIVRSIEVNMPVPGGQPYFFSLPFDVRIIDGVLDSATGKPLVPEEEWNVAYYDGTLRARNSEQEDVSENYTHISVSGDSSLSLVANKGYILTLDRNRTVRFIHRTDSATSHNLFSAVGRSVPLDDHIAGANSEFDDGWNLIGIPFVGDYDFANSSVDKNSLPRYLYHYNPLTKRFDLLDLYTNPNDTIRPFSAYFLQSERAKTMDFPSLSSSVQLFSNPVSENAGTFLLSDDDGVQDRTDLIFNDNATAGYVINEDAAKILQKGMPRIYTFDDDAHYAVNRRPAPVGQQQLSMTVYVPDENSYRIDLVGAGFANNFQQVLITQESSFEAAIDLLSSPMVIEGESGLINYTITVVPKTVAIDGTENENPYGVVNSGTLYLHNLPAVCRIDIYEMNGTVIYSQDVLDSEAEFVLPTTGIYIVRVKKDDNVDTFKVVN
ncbi:MAG: T9SS type A sorting domain-containing protein [Bacteroidales bacterium]|nr:T9SS type A sorting domain-containing protein [Bacteroidales bacterium]